MIQDSPDAKDLQERLNRARNDGVGDPTEEELARKKEIQEDSNNMQLGIRAGSELLVGLVAGGFIGYWLDVYFETKPFLFIFFLLVGVCTGFMNIYKITQKIGTSVGYAELHKREKKGK